MPFRDSEIRLLLQGILAAASAPVCVISQDFTFIAFNDEFRDEFHAAYGVEVEVGTSLAEALAHLPNDQERGLDLWKRALAGEEFTMTSTFGDPQRHRRIYELTYRGLRDESGEQVGAVLFARDLTKQHAAEAARRQSEERFEELADAMPQLVWTARADGTVDYYNQRREEFEGIAYGTEGGWSWSPVVHPDDRAATIDAWEYSVRTGELYEIEHRIKVKDGTYRWYLSRGVPAYDEHGEVVRWYGTATDIEATKRAEITLRHADRRKDEFLAMLGHELRNPLAAIANGVRVVDRGGEPARQALPMVQRHVTQMSRLLDDLLDVTRITRGRLNVERRVQPLAPIIASAVASVRPRSDDFGHTVEVPEVPDVAVDADATRLEQIVTNLLDNAVSYTPPEGRISVWIEPDDDTVTIHVRDTGRGIRREDLEAIFEPFRQGEGKRSRGLGIGLALAKQLVELHEGTIEVRSEGPGQGSEFVVTLPRAQDIPTDALEAHPLPGRLDGLRVLAVDDNVDAAYFMAVLLQDAGSTVELAATGAEGFDKAKNDDFDVVLLDIGLPDMSGRDLVRRLRQLPAYADTRMVAISGYGQDRDIADSLEAGFDAHLAKPVSPEQLRAAILADDPEAIQKSVERHDSALADRNETGNEARPAELLPLIRQLVHDLRSPLSAVEFSSAILEHHADADAPEANLAERLARSSATMSQILERALDMAELEAGSATLDLQPIRLEELSDAVQGVLEAESRVVSRVAVEEGAERKSGRWDRQRLVAAIAHLAARSEPANDVPAVRFKATDDSATIEIVFEEAVPSPSTTREETANYDSLHMDVRYADEVVRAHGGRLDVVVVEDNFVVRMHLPGK
ncbi:response regulator [Persicimonas caeni]|uniref:histidine kinase n=1 Tax=Persicimonas caeni TaxID=2292766 RepID=A0A4Y6PWC8_PERCE|nr:ATP-binding protein [Persicimonas caeni]QDG52563.1 response regulator [Persicimonas caeni]QED33785.1 response regulator [Persicimonas caeni]